MNELVSVESYTLDEAHELVGVISSRLVAINDHMDALRGEVPRLYHAEVDGQRSWIALGYASWDELAKNEFMSAIVSLTKEERKPLVQAWRAEGLSTRAIGSALGVSNYTVSKDAEGVSNLTPASVVGIDGKTYTRPEKTEPPVIDAEIVSEEVAEMSDEDEYPVTCGGVESPDASIRAVKNFLHNLTSMPMRPKDRTKLIKILRQALTKLESKA